jgi:two-component system sensor histidine kinase BaeS
VLRAGVRGSRALVVAAPDRSVTQALSDLLGTLPLVVAVTLLVGLVVVTWLSRSVTEPLARLSHATRRLAGGAHDGPLALEGPTEVRKLTESFQTMRDELAGARRRESELLADLRHDLRTPLTVISGFATALADGTATGPAADRAAASIVREAGRMTTLIDDLGVTAGEPGAALRLEPVDAAAIVTETVERFSASAADLGVSLAASVPDAAIPLLADRAALERILANLVQNALASIEAGGGQRGRGGTVVGPVTAWVEVAARRSGDPHEPLVVLAVSDNGPGFPPGLVLRAFDRLVRGDPARSGVGSGLGLAIVRQLVVAHGGSVVAENLGPRGARVSVTLPAAGRSPSDAMGDD